MAVANRRAKEMPLDSGIATIQQKYLAQFWHSQSNNDGAE
jgi:hypothetical protein